MTNSEQALREKAINIFADIFTAGGDAHEVGGQSFDQLQQSGYIDRKITDLTALISEHTQQMFEFVRWIGFYSTTLYYRDFDEKWLRTRFDVDGCPTEEYDEYTTEELFEYWKTNEQ